MHYLALSEEFSALLTRYMLYNLLDPLRILSEAVGETFVGLWFAPGLRGRVSYGIEVTEATDPSVANVLESQLGPLSGELRDLLTAIAQQYPRHSVLQVKMSQTNSSTFALTITLQRTIDGMEHTLIHECYV